MIKFMIMRKYKYYKVEVHLGLERTNLSESSKRCLGLYQKNISSLGCMHEGLCPFGDRITFCRQIEDYEEI